MSDVCRWRDAADVGLLGGLLPAVEEQVLVDQHPDADAGHEQSGSNGYD